MELNTKQDYQDALHEAREAIKKSGQVLNDLKKRIRQCRAKYINDIIRNDLKSNHTQEAYIIKSFPDSEILFELLDEEQESYNHLIREHEDIRRLLGISKEEMKIM